MKRIRNTYRFDTPLTADESQLLMLLIGWRRGSHVLTNAMGAVIGCIAHPDDLDEFEKDRNMKKKCL